MREADIGRSGQAGGGTRLTQPRKAKGSSEGGQFMRSPAPDWADGGGDAGLTLDGDWAAESIVGKFINLDVRVHWKCHPRVGREHTWQAETVRPRLGPLAGYLTIVNVEQISGGGWIGEVKLLNPYMMTLEVSPNGGGPNGGGWHTAEDAKSALAGLLHGASDGLRWCHDDDYSYGHGESESGRTMAQLSSLLRSRLDSAPQPQAG